MNNENDELRRLLRERADRLPTQPELPPALLGRVRRRMARNAVAVVAVVGLLMVGAVSGVRAFAPKHHLTPVGQPTPTATAHRHHSPSPTPSPSPSPSSSPSSQVSSCPGGQLRATAELTGAAGSVVGALDVTNFGSTTCTLQGRPKIALSDWQDHPLQVQQVPVPPMWEADGASPPPGWPVVTLRPGAVAQIRVAWSNLCPQNNHPALWRVTIGGQTIDVFGADGTSPPPCNGAGQPSTLQVGPFEPQR
jgi:hypothetical protein